jgi:uncharacterized membrane protein YfcA
VTHWLGGVAAFGSTLLAFPALVWLVDVRTARTALLLLGTVQAYQVFAYTYRHIVWREFFRMVLVAGLGLPIGVLALQSLPGPLLIGLLGVVLIVSGGTKLIPKRRRSVTAWPAPALYALLLLGGIIHGAFVSGGAALVVYAQHRIPQKDGFRGTLCAFWVLMNTILVALLFVGGDGVGDALPIFLFGLPLVLVVSWLANRHAKKLSEQSFARWVAILLVIGGVMALGRALIH